MAADLLVALLGMNLAAGAAILAVLALRRGIRRLFGARLAYALWITPLLAAAASLLPARKAETLLVEPAPLRPIAEAAVEVLTIAAPTPQAADVALALWALGAAAAIGFIAWRQRAALSLLGRLTPEEPGLLRSANPAVGPAIIGVVSPRIVIPADFERRFAPREQAMVMAHERSHLAVGDVRLNALVAFVRCLCWFNPLVHLAAVLIRVDQELACDEAVIRRHPTERRPYAEALLKTQVAPAPLPLGCYWPVLSTPRLKERIVMLTRASPGRGRLAAGSALVAILGLGAGYAAWAAQPAEKVLATAAAPVLSPLAAPALSQTPSPTTSPPTRRRVILRYDADESRVEEPPVASEIQDAPPRMVNFVMRREITSADREVIERLERQFEAGALPPEGQRRLILRSGRRAPEGAQADVRALVGVVGPGAPLGPGAVRLRCVGTGEGGLAQCQTLEGDEAAAAAAIAKLTQENPAVFGRVPEGADINITYAP